MTATQKEVLKVLNNRRNPNYCLCKIRLFFFLSLNYPGIYVDWGGLELTEILLLLGLSQCWD